jgi:diguanylate cyclase (GGDEF)-like protein
MKRKKDADTLFDQEKKVLESALTNLMRDDYKEHPLFEAYQSLTHHYEKLLRQSRKLLRISDSQYNLLQKVENDIRILLNHAGQGFLSFGPDLTVNRQYSEECVRIFGQKIENVNIIDLLLAPEETELRDLFARVFCEVFQDTELSEKESQLNRLPAQMLINDRFINLDYRVVSGLTDNKSEGLIMLILTDITEKQAAEAQIHFLSYHDSLTGVYNRAYIDSIINKLDREEELPLSMIMADVNGLKLTNDVFGHQAGDRLLRNLAQLLVKCLRSHDPVARWGGDEFLILLPRTGEDVLALITERINASCHSADPDPIPLSVAIGAATRHSMKESLADLFRRAEDLMYSHKLKESQQVRRYIVDSLNNNLAARSFESKEHIQRVKDMALALGYRLGLNQQEKKELEMLALLHDIGMITVPDGLSIKRANLPPPNGK